MGDNSSSERTLEYMVRKRQKTIGNYIMFILLAVSLIPLIAMALAIYDTTSDLLMARNDSAKLRPSTSFRRSAQSFKSKANMF